MSGPCILLATRTLSIELDTFLSLVHPVRTVELNTNAKNGFSVLDFSYQEPIFQMHLQGLPLYFIDCMIVGQIGFVLEPAANQRKCE